MSNIKWNGEKTIYPIVIDKAIQQFTFPVAAKPELVLFDAEQQLLGVINHKKSVEELVYQYNHSDKYLAREEALEALATAEYDSKMALYNPLLDSIAVFNTYLKALEDPFYDIKELAIGTLIEYKGKDTLKVAEKIKTLAQSDKKASVRALSLEYLSATNSGNEEISKTMLSDSAYSVVAAALSAYISVGNDEEKAAIVQKYREEEKLDIIVSVAQYYIDSQDSTQMEWFLEKMGSASPRDMIGLSQFVGDYTSKVAKSESEKAITFAEELASTHDHFYARFAGYKILWLLDSVEGVTEKRKNIVDNETNKILIDAYERWESRIIRIGN